MNNLNKQFESVVMQYVQTFCIKHGFNMDDCSWVGDHVGEVLEIADYYFGFDDIRMDIDKNLPPAMIMEWYNATLEHAMYPEHHTININSWAMGLRYEKPYTKTQLLKWRLRPIWNTIHWHFVGKREMKAKMKEIILNTHCHEKY